MSVRDFIGLIDPCVREEGFALRPALSAAPGTDFSRCVSGILITHSSLDFKQSSLTHTIQVLGGSPIKRLHRSPLYRHALFPFRFPLSVGRLTS